MSPLQLSHLKSVFLPFSYQNVSKLLLNGKHLNKRVYFEELGTERLKEKSIIEKSRIHCGKRWNSSSSAISPCKCHPLLRRQNVSVSGKGLICKVVLYNHLAKSVCIYEPYLEIQGLMESQVWHHLTLAHIQTFVNMKEMNILLMMSIFSICHNECFQLRKMVGLLYF